MIFKFTQQNPDSNKRLAESSKIREKYPDRIPIICERDPRSFLLNCEKNKFLVPGELTISQFGYIIRKRISMDKSNALFLLINGKNSIAGDISMSEIYDKHKTTDGFLYISYTGEVLYG
jgi:GABA(A) receptor-associated protein